MNKGPIGIFDSGYGGLTVMREIVNLLPHYDYLYLGDNARSPYGTRSFETIYAYTLECVKYLFEQDCQLVILACNTASAKALRNIQQLDLPRIDPTRRVLGVIRPTAEMVGTLSNTGHVGILGTPGTVRSESYVMEIGKLFPDIDVFQEACPMWVPLVENGEANLPGADYFVRQHVEALLSQSGLIDTIILACTHYPLLLDKITQYTPADITLISQGAVVAQSLQTYLERHPEMEARVTKGGQSRFLTTDTSATFDAQAEQFFGEKVQSTSIHL